VVNGKRLLACAEDLSDEECPVPEATLVERKGGKIFSIFFSGEHQ
jgi:hypothetical protein